MRPKSGDKKEPYHTGGASSLITRVLTERLQIAVPDAKMLEAHAHFFGWALKQRPPRHPRDRSTALVSNYATRDGHLPLSIICRETGDNIGYVYVTINLDAFLISEDDDGNADIQPGESLELGIRIYVKPDHRGNGYATEVGRLFVDYATAVLKARRVVAQTQTSEPAAVRLMERIGMAVRPVPTADRPDRVVGVWPPDQAIAP